LNDAESHLPVLADASQEWPDAGRNCQHTGCNYGESPNLTRHFMCVRCIIGFPPGGIVETSWLAQG
jgi:hypothetical protein